MKYVIRYFKLYIEGTEVVDDRRQPVWSAKAKRFNSLEEAEAFKATYPGNRTLRAAVIEPVAD